jgi:ketosteroid isomerase-like protein
MGQDRSMSDEQAHALVERALAAIVSGDVSALELFTDDVVGDSPNMCVHSRSELEFQLIDRQGALSNIELTVESIETVEPGVTATWRMSGDHTGEVLFNEDELFEPSGRRIQVSATTLVQFRDRHICAFRTDYDDRDLYDQVRAPHPSGER